VYTGPGFPSAKTLQKKLNKRRKSEKGREMMKINGDDSSIFVPFALANPAIILYKSTEHRAHLFSNI
jgi:hypothetical protein